MLKAFVLERVGVPEEQAHHWQLESTKHAWNRFHEVSMLKQHQSPWNRTGTTKLESSIRRSNLGSQATIVQDDDTEASPEKIWDYGVR